MLIADRTGYVLSALFAVTTALAAMISPAHQREHDWQVGEYYGVMLLSASGMVMLAHAANLVTVFLGIENMSLGGFLMYGIALLYGAAGTTKIAELATKLSTAKNPGLVVAGGLMLAVAFGFKV